WTCFPTDPRHKPPPFARLGSAVLSKPSTRSWPRWRPRPSQPSYTSLPAGLELRSIRYLRRPIEKMFRRSFSYRLLLNHSRLIRLLTRHVGHHQLAEFHKLLDLLLGNLPHDLKGFEPAIGRLSHRAQGIQDRLFTLKLLALKASRAQSGKGRIEGCLQPGPVLSEIAGTRVAVTGKARLE